MSNSTLALTYEIGQNRPLEKLDEVGLVVKAALETEHSTEAPIHEYAQRLVAASNAMPSRVEAFRFIRHQQFIQLCTFHLSLLIDLPFHIPLEQLPPTFSNNTTHKHGYATRSANKQKHDSNTAICDNVIRLMEYLMKCDSDFLRTEGIFRKTGNITRQRELCNRLLDTSTELHFPVEDGGGGGGDFSVHDYAATLKTVLRDMLPNALLTNELLPLYDALAQQLEGDHSTQEQLQHELIQAKLLNALRLLRILLPTENQRLLQHLLSIMTRTLQFSEYNRMTAESLGTIFGPILFAPKDVSFGQYFKYHTQGCGFIPRTD